MKYKVFILIAFLLLVGVHVLTTSNAFSASAPISWQGDFTNQIVEPLKTFKAAVLKFANFTATSTTATSSIAGKLAVTGTTTLATTTTGALNGMIVVDGIHYS